jgi:alkylation response protein AidB-like acyl-CoA dehydrogenase
MRRGLIDDFRPFVVPVVVGGGTPFFPPDVHIALELARPLLFGAALSLASNSSETARDVSAAKVAAAEAATLAARNALQTHGAIGFTSEHDLSLWLLRVQALRSAWGDPAAHRRRVLEAM